MNNKIELKLFPFQMELLKALNKYDVVTMAIGRRMGKSYAAALAAILHCVKAKLETPRRVLIISPTAEMSRESYWSQLKEFLLLYKPFIFQLREREKEITFKNGSIISLKSADKPDTLRGISGKAVVSFVIMDEFSFLRDAERLFEEVIMPYKANSNVHCKFLCISTPKGTGNFFHKMYEKGLNDKNGDNISLHYSCYDAQPTLKEQFDKQKDLMSDRAFKQEYLAEFIGSGNSAFYAFDRKLHIDPNIKPIQKGETVVIGLDANIGLMTNIVARVKANPDNKSYYIEVVSESEGKYKNVDQLITDYNKFYRTELNCPIVVCPDASMAQRAYSASLGVTGMSKLKDAGWLVKTERKNPTYIDSVQSVNQAFLRGDNTINLKIHPSCVKLIHSIEIAQWKEGTDGHQLDKTSSSAEGHIQDCLRYLIWQYKTVIPTITIRRTTQF